MNQYGTAILVDLRNYYGIDLVETIRGTGMAPRLVLWHIEALPDTSLLYAMRSGGWEYRGWGQDRHLLADLVDSLALNTELTGMYEKPPKLSRFPRPTTKQPDDGAPKKGRTVKELFAQIKT